MHWLPTVFRLLLLFVFLFLLSLPWPASGGAIASWLLPYMARDGCGRGLRVLGAWVRLHAGGSGRRGRRPFREGEGTGIRAPQRRAGAAAQR